MKEIYYITNVRLPTHRAHGLQIMKSCEAFAKNGVSVKLIVPRLKPTFSYDPFDYYGVSKNFSIYRMPVLELVPLEKWLGRWVGYIQNLSFSLCAIACALFNGWHKTGRIFYTRDYMTAFVMAILNLHQIFELHDYRSKKHFWRIGFILRKSRMIITNSEGTLESLRSHYNIDEKKVVIAPNGVDINFFNIQQSQSESKSAISISSDSTVISYIGSLETVGFEKGISILLRAFANISDIYPDTFLLIVGGPSHLVFKYKQMAQEIGIQKNRIRFAGQIEYHNIPVYLRATDIAVIPLPKNQHGITTSPIKLFEYMAAGKTILASDLPSLRKYLGEQSAEFFEPSSVSSLTEHLKKLLNDSAYARSLAENAKNDVAKYTWNARANLIINDIYV